MITSRIKFTFFYFLAVNFVSFSTQQTSTGSPCDESGDTIKFEQGKSYRYDFSSVTTQHFTEGESGISNLLINGNAILTKTAPCEYILSLEKLAVLNRDSKGPVLPDNVTKSAVRFTRRNGVVDEFFVSENENTWSVNIKRAIVSMLQNKVFVSETASTTMEVSVSGKCPTTHYKSGDNYIKQINLNHCAQRETIPNAHLGIPYDVSPGLKYHSFPLLNSSLFCEQALAAGIIQSVTCNEEHKSHRRHEGYHRQHNSKTLIKSSLKLTATEATIYTADDISKMTQDIKSKSTIIFDQLQKKLPALNADAEKNTENKIKSILNHLESDIPQAEYYMQLLEAIQELKYPMEIYSGKDVPLTKKAKKLFSDAIAETDTLPAFLFLTKLIEDDSDAVTDITKIGFYRRMSYSKEPTNEGLDALDSLIKKRVVGETAKDFQRELDSHLLLGASGYAHQFCSIFGEVTCTESASLGKLTETISKFILEGGISMKDSNNAAIPALHALGNIQKLSPGAVNKILMYLSDTQEDWVKILAMQAFRNDPCQKELKENVRKVLGTVTFSEDLRINAYLAMTKCLVPEDYASIQTLFNDPSSDRVARFIISHVRNIKDSASPSKQKLKTSLSQITIPENFKSPTVSLLTSRYVEYSTFSDETNVGFSASASLIFGNYSDGPLAVTLEVTVDAVGRSYNIFEVALSRRTVKRNNDSHYSYESNMYDHIIELLHSCTRNDVYLRMLGLTTRVGDFRNTSSGIFSVVLKAMDGVQVTDGAIEVVKTHPFTFLNLEFSYPTISGFPLSLDFQGTSVHSVKQTNLEGGASYIALKTNPIGSAASIKSDIRKSDSISLKCAMRVGRPNFTPMNIGILKEYSLDSLVEMGVDLEKQKLNKIHLKIRLPKQDFATFSFSKTMFYFEDVDGSFNKVPFSNSVTSGDLKPQQHCARYADDLSGILLCSTASFPYNGIENHPEHYNLTLRKSDEKMEGFEIKWDADYEPHLNPFIGNATWSLVMDTPGSTVPRKVTIQYQSKENFVTEQSNEKCSKIISVITPSRTINATAFAGEFEYPREGSNTRGIKTIMESTVYMSDVGTYKLKYVSRSSEYEFNNETNTLVRFPLSVFGLHSEEFSDEFQLIYPNEKVMVSAHQKLNQKNLVKGGEFVYSAKFAGDLLQNSGLIGDIQATYAQQPDSSETREITNLEIKSENTRMGKIQFQTSTNRSYTTFDSDSATSVKVRDNTYTYSTIVRESKECTDENGKEVRGHYVMNSTYSESPRDFSASLHSYLEFGNLNNETHYQEVYAGLTINPNRNPNPIIFKAEMRQNSSSISSIAQIEERGEQIMKIQGETDFSENYTKSDTTFQMFVRRTVDLKYSSEWTEKKMMAAQMEAKCLNSNNWFRHSYNITTEGDLMKKHADTAWGLGDKTLGTVMCDSNVNVALRTLDAKTVVNVNDQITTVATNGTLAKDVMNGHSGLIIMVDPASGEKIRELIELDTKEDKENEAQMATFHFLIEDLNKQSHFQPIELTLKSGLSWKNTAADMNFTHHFSNDLTYNIGCLAGHSGPCRNLHVVSDVNSSLTAARDLFTVLGSLKSEGSIWKADLEGSVELSDPTTRFSMNHGVLRINGTSLDERAKEFFTSTVTYDMAPDECSSKFYTTFTLTETDLKSGVTITIFDGESNSTRFFKSLTDFDMTETGRITTAAKTTKWAEIIRLRNNEFLFLYDIAEGQDSKVFVEFYVKLHKENEQMKLDVKSKNNFDYKPSNFNFTLTR